MDGLLWKCKALSPYATERIGYAAPASVCYEEDLYTVETEYLLNQLDDQDPFHIERYAFPYEESELIELLDVLSAGQQSLIQVRYKRLLRILLDIKRRNPAFRNIITDAENTQAALDGNLFKLRKAIARNASLLSTWGVNGTTLLSKVAQQVTQYIHQPEFRNDLYRAGFIRSVAPQRQLDALSSILADGKAYLLTTTASYPFVTSDNPGFCVTKDGIPEMVNFGERWMSYCFPIGPMAALYISNQRDQYRTFKAVQRVDCRKELVDHVNLSTCLTCSKIVISNSKKTLLGLRSTITALGQREDSLLKR